MPRQFCGFGTAFAGQRDFWPDGSYITTEWVIFFFVPVRALRSLRVNAGPRRISPPAYPVVSSERNYIVSDEMPPHRKQVLCVYAFTVCYVAWIIGGFALLFGTGLVRSLENGAGEVAVAAILGLPWIVPLYARKRAKRWRPGFK